MPPILFKVQNPYLCHRKKVSCSNFIRIQWQEKKHQVQGVNLRAEQRHERIAAEQLQEKNAAGRLQGRSAEGQMQERIVVEVRLAAERLPER